jgi:hypothetical protein
MPTNDQSVKISQFLGLRNTDRPARLPEGALVDAVNIDIDDTGGIERRAGYSTLTGLTAVTAAYATLDEASLYVVDGGILKRVMTLSPLVTTAVAISIGNGEVWWAENGEHIFCSGAANGIIYGNQLFPYGEWGSDDQQVLDAQGQSLFLDEADIGTLAPPENTECVAFFEGCVWLSYYDTAADQTFIFRSKPFFWSRWDTANDYIAVLGHVRLLAAPKNSSGMVIGTDRAIHVYSQGALQQVADWGVAPGQHDEDDGKVYFWTDFGLCRALPFEAMTDSAVSVNPATRAVVSVAYPDLAHTRAIVVTTGGGVAENPYA